MQVKDNLFSNKKLLENKNNSQNNNINYAIRKLYPIMNNFLRKRRVSYTGRITYIPNHLIY